MTTPRHPVIRIALIVLGVVIFLLGFIVAPIPGPGGVFFFAGGMILILRNSRWAKLKWARLKRRRPKMGHLVDRVMRRPSALRRHARDRIARVD